MSLTVKVQSFSFKKGGIPADESDNGGGFVFDCRGITNPGRINEYKTQTGRDTGVIEYLENQTVMPKFIEYIQGLISISIDDYIVRDFDNLMISFGCTGGQHRSVYAADTIARYIQDTYPTVEVKVTHIIQEQKNWINEPY